MNNDPYYQRNMIFQLLCSYAGALGGSYCVVGDPDLPGFDVVILEVSGTQLSFHIPHSEVVLPIKEGLKWDGHSTEQKMQRIEDLIHYLTET